MRLSKTLELAAFGLLLLAVAARGALAASGADWPRWRGPTNDGVSAESDWTTEWPSEGPKVLWRASVGKGFSSVSVAGGRLYTMGNLGKTEDVVWCLDAETGKEIWSHRYRCREGDYPGPRATPTVDGGAVYTLSREGHLFALGAKDGKVLWSKEVVKDFGVQPSKHGWGLACSPLVLGDRLILDLGKALALEKKTGALVWASGDDMAGFSSPTLTEAEGKTYVNCFTAHGLVLVEAAAGKEAARVRWETAWDVNAASPIVRGTKIFISSGYDAGCALYEWKGGKLEPVYTNRKMRNHCNSSVLYAGHIYGIDGQMGGSGRLRCLDFATGEIQWERRGSTPGGMIIAGGRIVALLDKGELLVARATPERFELLAQAKVLPGHQCWTSPVLSRGRLYCRSNKEGELVCLDVRGN
ncbi:MAG: outer membrane protein assembly factor BamB family protein [Planctomycetota bacterium]